MIEIMKILAFECSTATASVAVGDNGKIIGESSMEASRRHSEQLLPMADELLASLGLTLADIGALACSVGPGSFTGVRIGAATVKGLAFGSSRPCVGTSSLTSLAYCHSNSEDGTIICPVIGCRRGNVYNALYRVCGGEITRLCDDRMISCTELAEELISRGEQVIICGDEVPAVTALCPDDIVCKKTAILCRPPPVLRFLQTSCCASATHRALRVKTNIPTLPFRPTTSALVRLSASVSV